MTSEQIKAQMLPDYPINGTLEERIIYTVENLGTCKIPATTERLPLPSARSLDYWMRFYGPDPNLNKAELRATYAALVKSGKITKPNDTPQ